MALTLPFCSNLAEALSSGGTSVRLQDPAPNTLADLCAALAAPAHAFATIYTLNFSEVVLVSACGAGVDAGKLIVTRGSDGTSARSWPANACFKITEILPGAVCADTDGGTDDACPPFDPVAMLPVGPGLCWDLTEPGNPKLGLCATGVVPANMACGEINAYGQLVNIPVNWPASCLTPFDPCCDGGAGGGGLNACDVSYSTSSGSGVITGGTVCEALDQLADAVGGAGGGSGVASVGAGTGIDVTGTASAPVVSIEPSGIVAGTYGGFAIDASGRVTSYTAPAGGGAVASVTGTSPVVVSGGSAVTVSVLAASSAQIGVVTLADAAEAANATPNVADDAVITWEFLQLWATTQGLI